MESPRLLLIETATNICSVSVSCGTEIMCTVEDAEANSHAGNLLPSIDSALKKSKFGIKDIDGVAVSIGPGSYTGLRIGISTAKGIAYTAGIPVIAIGTLESIAQGARQLYKTEKAHEMWIVPMLDARRMEVFTAVYDFNMNIIENVTAKIIDENSFSDILRERKLLFCGNGMPKCRELLSKNCNSEFVDFSISAKYMLEPALDRLKAGKFEDVAYFEPYYLKEYIAAKPVVKGLV